MRKIFATILAATAIGAAAVNPYMPLWEYIPDGEPYVFEDPDNPGQYRVYVYGSHDNLITHYCGRDQVVWSAPVDDLSAWRYDGVIFELTHDANGEPLNYDGSGDVLYAPDVALKVNADGTKTYYLYPNVQGYRNHVVAKSDRPDGPFEVCNWSANDPKQVDGVFEFDPAAFVDDDGRAYGYWGFGTSYAAELDPETMATPKPGTEIIEGMITGFEEEGIYRFFEASSIRKIKDKYVFIYSRMTAPGEFGLPASNYTLAYCYSDSPLGPWTYGGTIIDGRGRETQPDGTVIPTVTPNGNTHGSICEINGKWWVFYHRQTGLNEFSRQAMVAPIEVTVEEGPGGKVAISEGELTSEGFETEGLSLFGKYPAGIACYYTGPTPAVHAWPSVMYSGSYVQPVYFNGDKRHPATDVQLRMCPMVNNTAGSVVGYKYFNFDGAKGKDALTLTAEIKPMGIDGTVTVMAVSPYADRGGIKLGEFAVGKDDLHIPTTVTANITGFDGLAGRQPIYFVFDSPTKGVSLCDFYSFGFE